MDDAHSTGLRQKKTPSSRRSGTKVFDRANGNSGDSLFGKPKRTTGDLKRDHPSDRFCRQVQATLNITFEQEAANYKSRIERGRSDVG